VLCYQNIYPRRHKGGQDRKGTGNLPGGEDKKKGASPATRRKLAPKEFTENQKGMLTAFNRYVCYIKPKANDKEAQEQYVEVKYARARTYFEAQHWEEAALGFRDVAINHADNDAAIYAAQLYLESLNIMGAASSPRTPPATTTWRRTSPSSSSRSATNGKEKDEPSSAAPHPHPARHRAPARREARRGRRQAPGRRAPSSTRRPPNATWTWEKYGEAAVQEQQAARLRARNEEILYNAARAFQAARLLAKAIAVRGRS
jgi:hypothetical protein